MNSNTVSVWRTSGGTKIVSACFQVMPCHTWDVRSTSYVKKSFALSFLRIVHANASSFAATYSWSAVGVLSAGGSFASDHREQTTKHAMKSVEPMIRRIGRLLEK